MDRERIDDIVCEIMVNDGPDKHVDGHDIITEFIVALLNGGGEKWYLEYENHVKDRSSQFKEGGFDLYEKIKWLTEHRK